MFTVKITFTVFYFLVGVSCPPKGIKRGGVAWSSGQYRSLPLQGSRVHIPAIPSFFAAVTAMMLRWQPKQFNYGSGTPQARRVGPKQRREQGNKMN